MVKQYLPWLMTFSCAGVCLLGTGCRSPYHADRGTAFGAGTGAVLGAIVGEAASNNPLAGAAIGTVAGAVVGNAVGSSMDEMEARNRAAIEAQLGQQIPVGRVTVQDVVSLSNSRIADELIINHIRGNGMVAPLTTNDLVYLNNAGVSPNVIAVMQEPPPAPPRQPVIVEERPVVVHQPAPVVVHEYWGPPRHHYCHPPRRAGFHFHIR
ncbi:Hypothetical protein PBC10988_7420 [Planctomycetales bacterium 10988]|nr:Hypothetical protein PBC10988_7420 [Planctomycetales bacterium 10988]